MGSAALIHVGNVVCFLFRFTFHVHGTWGCEQTIINAMNLEKYFVSSVANEL